MALSKTQQNSIRLDPKRAEISKKMGELVGGPQNNKELNSPVNITALGSQPSSFSGVNEFNYGDKGLKQPHQLGADAINPMNIAPSGLQQSYVKAGRGLNQVAYGMQNQPIQFADAFESQRQALAVSQKGLPSGAMGLTSVAPIPGMMPQNMIGTSGPPLYPNMPKKGGKA